MKPIVREVPRHMVENWLRDFRTFAPQPVRRKRLWIGGLSVAGVVLIVAMARAAAGVP